MLMFLGNNPLKFLMPKFCVNGMFKLRAKHYNLIVAVSRVGGNLVTV